MSLRSCTEHVVHKQGCQAAFKNEEVFLFKHSDALSQMKTRLVGNIFMQNTAFVVCIARKSTEAFHLQQHIFYQRSQDPGRGKKVQPHITCRSCNQLHCRNREPGIFLCFLWGCDPTWTSCLPRWNADLQAQLTVIDIAEIVVFQWQGEIISGKTKASRQTAKEVKECRWKLVCGWSVLTEICLLPLNPSTHTEGFVLLGHSHPLFFFSPSIFF